MGWFGLDCQFRWINPIIRPCRPYPLVNSGGRGAAAAGGASTVCAGPGSSPSSLDQGDRRRRAPTRLSVDALGTPPHLLSWIDRNTASPMGSSKLAGMDAGEEVRKYSTTQLRFVAEVDVAAWRRLDFAWCV